MDFLQELGIVALGSRLRRLGDLLAGEAAQIYAQYGVEIQPKWFPVFYLLARNTEMPITSMAKSIGCSHPVVSQTVKEMVKAGLAETSSSIEDARKNVVKLTDAGRSLIPNMEEQMEDVSDAVAHMLSQTRHNIWQAMDELEDLLTEKDLQTRVRDQRKQREAARIKITPYSAADHADYRRINLEWVEQYFEPEPADYEVLDHPQEMVITPGGAILIARLGEQIVGTVGLQKIDKVTVEMIKMAVSKEAKGRGIGTLLGEAALNTARELGFHKVFLESNTKLVPAITLYKKLGFKRVTGGHSPYARCNIQMEREV